MKWLGDGVMFYFPDPGAGVVAALDMSEGMEMHALPPAHVGIHAGPVVLHQGDYFGRTVNVAARIADYARPSEVLVSQEVVDAVSGSPGDVLRGRCHRVEGRVGHGSSPRGSSSQLRPEWGVWVHTMQPRTLRRPSATESCAIKEQGGRCGSTSTRTIL